jgi:23S rRNA (uracil1939-C5)-methyltransferase
MSEKAADRIVRLSHQGDGETGAGVFVPFTAPGDRVRLDVEGRQGRLIELVEPGPDRIAPVCAHFGDCGGCALQHIAAPALAAWKRDLIAQALQRQGVPFGALAPTMTVPPRSRRRAELHARKTAQGVKLGFMARGAHVVADVRMCEILAPPLMDLVPALRQELDGLLPPHKTAAVAMLASRTGVDLALGLPDPVLDARARQALVEMAQRLDLTRLSVGGEPVVQRREPIVSLAGVAVLAPVEGFFQAAEEAERALQSFALEAAGWAKSALDLFAGSGTFTFALAAHMPVTAIEQDNEAVSALSAAAKRAKGLRPVQTERRDLFRRPLLPMDLDLYDVAVIDPPRAGARAQCAELARSKLPVIIMASCNPATFARDAAALVQGGYALERILPVDQFRWAPHVELIARFVRRDKGGNP